MKKNKTRRIYRFSHKKYYIMIFLVFVLFLGIGYSMIETNLNIFGSINLSRYNEPVIAVTYAEDIRAFKSNTYRDNIRVIYLDDNINPPANYVESWDIGEAQNGNVMAYITADPEEDGMYDLYIQGKGHLYANEDSKYLFGFLRGVDSVVGLEKLDVSRTKNMAGMFRELGFNSRWLTLDLGDNFDTSNVTDMSYMFDDTGYSSPVFTLDLGSKFDTGNVTNMNHMFSESGFSNENYIIDLGSHFDTENVTDMSYMFYNSPYLKTIYVPSSFVTTNVTNSSNMFSNSTQLVGGMGTVYDSSFTEDTYAHIDDGLSNPGYFTDRTVYAQQLEKKTEIKSVSNIGKKVSFISKYNSDLIWRLFYADDDYVYLISSKLYDNNGDAYEIEAQRTNYGGLGGVGLISQQLSPYTGSEDITDPFLRSLNSMWYEFLADDQNAQYKTCESAKATAWFMDQNRWANWKDNNGYAKYAIGGPPLEIFVKSFNATAASNSRTPFSDLVINNGGYKFSNPQYKNLFYEYNNGIYHLRGAEDSFWLSSPGDNNGNDIGVIVRTSGGNTIYGTENSIYFGHTFYNLGLRPVVIIPIDDYAASPYDIISE